MDGSKARPSALAEKGEELHSVNFLRFVFSFILVYFHILHANIIPFTNGSKFYENLAENSHGDILVECFFILSGFFMFYSLGKKKASTFSSFAYSKAARLWPMLAFVTLLDVCFFNARLINAFFNLLFLQCVGLSLDYAGINWYISPLFWSFLFYFGLHRFIRDEAKFRFAAAVLTTVGYLMSFNAFGGEFSRSVSFGFVSLSMARAIAGMGLGYLIASIVQTLKENGFEERATSTKPRKALTFIIATAGEMGPLAFIMLNCFDSDWHYGTSLTDALMFAIMMVFLPFKFGLFSKIFGNRFFGFFGRYSYSVYVTQQTVINILARTLWHKTDFVQQHALWCIGVSLIISFLFSVAAYYIIEKPGAALFYKAKALFFAPKRADAE